MKKYEYNASVMAASQTEADLRMRVAMSFISKLTITEIQKVEKILSDPVQLALIKARL